ncbi:polysaccharide deacetylase family protein [Paraglaciecola aestuariivivens]
MSKAADKPAILFVLTIDTEEEWDWSGPFPQQVAEVDNIAKLPAFHQLCANLGIKPTYFIDFAVANNPQAVAHMRSFTDQGQCEVGAHLHPWCNPPYFGEVGEAESHVINLPVEQVEQKLQALVTQIENSFAVKPKSFRTGRWGIDSKVMQLLIKSGINVDSSVYPFYANEYFHCNGAPTLPYWPDLNNPLQAGSQNDIYEFPVTVGFNQGNFNLANKIHTAFAKPPLSYTRFNGFAWHTKLIRKTYLCPELSAPSDMLTLCHNVIEKGYPVLHMYMHSSSLFDNQEGLLGCQKNPFDFISDAVSQVVTELKQHYTIEFCTISQAADLLQKRNAGN